LLGATDEDEKRLLYGLIAGVHVYSAYVPNGKSLDSPSFTEKLTWLRQLRQTLDARHQSTEDVVVCGDFNIARDARDVHDPDAMQGQTHFSPEEHAALNEVLGFGLADTLRLLHQDAGLFSWWDYRAGAVRRNAGLRIDYIFASASLAERCTLATIDRNERTKAKPSDHAPVVAEFSP
jgi:exodeoxyribonuclease-3